jgi:RHS repeat-associated protein
MDDFGLINMNGRVYDPDLGLFLSPDPVLQDPANALNYNRYSYVLNNPLKYTDPSGYLFYHAGVWYADHQAFENAAFGNDGSFESPASGGGSRRGDSRLDAYSDFVKSLGTGGIELVITYTDWYQNKGPNGEFVFTNTSVEITITNNGVGSGLLETAGASAYWAGTINTLYGLNVERNLAEDLHKAKAYKQVTGKVPKSLKASVNYGKAATALTKGVSRRLFGVGFVLSSVDVYQDPSMSNIAWNSADVLMGAAAFIPGMQIPALIYFTARTAYEVYDAYNEP